MQVMNFLRLIQRSIFYDHSSIPPRIIKALIGTYKTAYLCSIVLFRAAVILAPGCSAAACAMVF
jgi:hypothetical protein